jgi:hypothetical protein
LVALAVLAFFGILDFGQLLALLDFYLAAVSFNTFKKLLAAFHPITCPPV